MHQRKNINFMKQLFSFLVLLFFTTLVTAQAPQAINYQGVARNASGAPYANQQISVRLSVRTGTADGPVEYSETRSVQTNQFGLFNVQPGSTGATNVQGDFGTIKWADGSKFLQTEISVNGQPYNNIGTTQMMSVPFSLHSKESKDLVLPFFKTVTATFDHLFRIKNEAPGEQSTILAESLNGYAVNAISENNSSLVSTTKAKKRSAIIGTAMADSSIGVLGSIPASYKGGVAVSGDGGLNNNGVRGKSTNKAAVQGFSENNYGVYGESKDFNAVAGSSFNMAGVAGNSVNNIGVVGLSEQGQGAVYGGGGQFTTKTQYGVMGEAFGNSVGVLAKSNATTATALLVDGKLKIVNSGYPSEGKVLTSDAVGNATWELPVSIAFRASSLRNDAVQAIPANSPKKVMFYQQARYNLGNAYDAENAIFFVPVGGIYQFHAQVSWESTCPNSSITIKLLRNGVVSNLAQAYAGSYSPSSVVITPSVSTEIALQANDAVWVEVSQSNESAGTRNLTALGYAAWFTGRLITRL
jgi:hypothetical protein